MKTIDADTVLARATPAAHQEGHETSDPIPGALVQLIGDEGDHDAERLDAAAGCEFVDDRIRLLE